MSDKLKSDKLKSAGLMSIKEVAFLSTQIGISVSLTTVLFVGGGKYLDNISGLSPLFTLLGIILGLGISLYLVWKLVKPLMIKHKTNFAVLKKAKHKLN